MSVLSVQAEMAKSSSVLTVINALLILLSLSAKLAEAVPVFTSHDGQESVPSMPASQFQLKPEAVSEHQDFPCQKT